MLSIVTTLYQSAPFIEEFLTRTTAAAEQLVGKSYEIVMVNDGSPDHGLNVARALMPRFPQLQLVDLSRNFGHHRAMMTGLSHARGELVFLIDVDLEESPEWLEDFDQRRVETGADVVFGVQRERKGGWFKRHSGALFYRIFRRISGLDLPDNIIVARIMTRRYVDALLQHREREVFIAGLWHITGFDQVPLTRDKSARENSTYTLRRRIVQFVDSLTSFSNKPLVYICYVGAALSSLAIVYVAVLVALHLSGHPIEVGWTSVMASIWLLGGINIFFVGIVGLYVAKLFSEIKQRPYSIVRAIYSKDEDKETS